MTDEALRAEMRRRRAKQGHMTAADARTAMRALTCVHCAMPDALGMATATFACCFGCSEATGNPGQVE